MIILDLHIAYVQETLEDAVSDLMKDLAKLRVDQADTRQRGEQAQEEVGTICIFLYQPLFVWIYFCLLSFFHILSQCTTIV